MSDDGLSQFDAFTSRGTNNNQDFQASNQLKSEQDKSFNNEIENSLVFHLPDHEDQLLQSRFSVISDSQNPRLKLATSGNIDNQVRYLFAPAGIMNRVRRIARNQSLCSDSESKPSQITKEDFSNQMESEDDIDQYQSLNSSSKLLNEQLQL